MAERLSFEGKERARKRLAIREFTGNVAKGTVAVYGLWLLLTLTANHFAFKSSPETAVFFAAEGIPAAVLFGLAIGLIGLGNTAKS